MESNVVTARVNPFLPILENGLYHTRVHLLYLLLTLFSGEIRRCALPYLSPSGRTHPTFASLQAPRQAAASLSSYQTDHFVFWWSTQEVAHEIAPAAAKVLAGDSVPELVRVAADGLEKAWRGYVDTLKYIAPNAASSSYLWRMPVPAGKYPVELCDVGVALGETGQTYFGVAYPDGSVGRSALMLASNLPTFGRWHMSMDLTGGTFQVDYSVDWRAALQATAAHELFHAVQFNYELALNEHSFFESSAVAMESRMVPASRDYLQYAQSLADLKTLVPFPTAVQGDAYPQGWFVRTMMTDLGLDVVKGLWESRKATATNPPSFLSTMRQVLPKYSNGSFDSLLIHQAMRVALTGKRSGWTSTQLSLFSDATYFPVLAGTLASSETFKDLPLALGAIQVLIDTLPATEERLLEWVPDEGVEMAQAANTATGTRVSRQDGSVRYSPTDATRSAWVFANPGNPSALRAYATSEASTSHYRTVSAPTRTAAQSGQKLTWTSPDGLVLTGTARADAQATPLLHVDVWKPPSSKDPFAARVASGTTGHTLVLEDADHALSLTGVTLEWAGASMVSAYQGRGDGVWSPVSVDNGSLSLGDVDLSHPLRILVSSTAAAQAAIRVPRPNPSRQGEAIHFPIAGAHGTERLTILAADGGIVRELHPDAGATEVVWDLRNRENRSVRPGVYAYVWRGVEGTNHGRLLVAE